MEAEAGTIPASLGGADDAADAAGARGPWTRWLLGALGVLALIGLGLVLWTWRHPSAFPEAGGWGTEARLEVGEPVFVAMTYPDEDAEGTVSIDKVEGHVISDPAAVKLAYFVCTIDKDSEGGILSARQAHVDEFCSALAPTDGSALSLGFDPREQLLLRVTPTRKGVMEIHGLDLTYSHGWQHGTQRIGGEVKVRASGPRR